MIQRAMCVIKIDDLDFIFYFNSVLKVSYYKNFPI